MSEKMVRMTFTVPPEFRDNLSYIALRFGVSKSAILSQAVGQSLQTMAELIRQVPEEVPDDDKPAVVKRFRDGSVTYINELSAELNGLFGGLEHDGNC